MKKAKGKALAEEDEDEDDDEEEGDEDEDEVRGFCFRQASSTSEPSPFLTADRLCQTQDDDDDDEEEEEEEEDRPSKRPKVCLLPSCSPPCQRVE